MGTASEMLAAARADLGLTGRPNKITRDYADRHGEAFLRAAWCDMAVTYWARLSGNKAAVLPGGDRAYTVWHATDFQKIVRWYTGTTANVDRAKPGDIVFFDWGSSNSIGAIDHVGVIERALGGGRVQTIEGNSGDQCVRRVRSAGVIAGYGRPDYGEEDDVAIDKDDVKKIWTADVLDAPVGPDGKLLNPKNAEWQPQSYLRETYQLLRQVRTQVAALARQQADVDEAEVARLVLAGLSPAAIADAVQSALPEDLARQVVDELTGRLAS